MSPDVGEHVSKILQSGYIGEGGTVQQFEALLKEKLRTDATPISTNSCTSAIYLSLLALGIGPGDEVITTPMTCTATNSPIVLLGARPVWADVSTVTGNILTNIGHLITHRTKAIIAVDWTGRSCDYYSLREFKLPIIQDAAHGPLLSNYTNNSTTGDLVCLSFGAIKHLTCGDGGAIIVNSNSVGNVLSDWIKEELRLLRWYGLDRTSSSDFRCAQDIRYVGGKFHMNNINAAIGISNLQHLEDIVDGHKKNALWLHGHIDTNNSRLFLAPYDPFSNYWVFPIIVFGDRRDEFKEYLLKNGIEASQVHARNDKHTAFKFPAPNRYGLELFDSRQINIPCGPWVTQFNLDYMARIINEWNPTKK